MNVKRVKDNFFKIMRPDGDHGCLIWIIILLSMFASLTYIAYKPRLETAKVIDVYQKDNAFVVADINPEGSKYLQIVVVLPKDVKRFKVNDIIQLNKLTWHEVVDYGRFQQKYTNGSR